jgi:UDP-N-acetylmuramoyl-tripeptide--D-alanyl-D-alanine ligase
MVARFSAEEVLEITGGRLGQGLSPDGIGRVSTDTRSLVEGDWYLALSGERFDGHNFLGDAFSRGACGAIVDERPGYAIGSQTFPLIVVENTLKAYHALASSWRDKVNPLVVGITGSSGKTTTKEMTASAFAEVRKVHKSEANENNEIGLPKTILGMPADTDVLILEMAMRARGEIALLARTGRPDIGIIVNVGVAHLGPLASLENIILAKCEIFEEMDTETGVAIIGKADDALLARVRQVFRGKTIVCDPASLREISVTPESTVFEFKGESGKMSKFEIRAHGLAHLQDAWCAITAAREAGLDDNEIAGGLREYNPVIGRGNRLVAPSGAVVVDESYNANPDSVKASITAFVDDRVYPQKNKYLVLGDLAELGDGAQTLHREIGEWLVGKKVSALITIGPLARHIAEGAQAAGFETVACMDQAEAENYLRPRLSNECSVLVKASHSAALDKLVSRLVSEN